MDIAERLRASVTSVPEGEHTPALRAVVRHIDAAIKHFERAQDTSDDDAFTDSIYRTNQAYEGSLKEAYRVIAEKNPHKKTLFDIEQFFQENKGLRARVLTQMSRYREDYRNPATHDYKLDFDENEALLAILSVSAFAKLLADQICSKIDFERARIDINEGKQKIEQVADQAGISFFESLSDKLLLFLNKASQSGRTERENSSIIAAFLDASGVNFDRNATIHGNGFFVEWDILIHAPDGSRIGFDIKSSRGRQSPAISEERLSNTAEWLHDSGMQYGFLIEGAARGDKYVRSSAAVPSGVTVHRLGKEYLPSADNC